MKCFYCEREFELHRNLVLTRVRCGDDVLGVVCPECEFDKKFEIEKTTGENRIIFCG